MRDSNLWICVFLCVCVFPCTHMCLQLIFMEHDVNIMPLKISPSATVLLSCISNNNMADRQIWEVEAALLLFP